MKKTAPLFLLVALALALSGCNSNETSSTLAEMQRERVLEAARIQRLTDSGVFTLSVDRDVLIVQSDLNMTFQDARGWIVSGCQGWVGFKQQLFSRVHFINHLENGVTQVWDVPLPVDCAASAKGEKR